MSVDKTPTGVVYTVTSGAAGQQYPLTFPYIKGADVKAYYVQAGTQTSLTYGTHYTVADQTFTASVALPTGAKLAIYRQTDLTQEILWKDGQAVYTPDIMKADDKLTLIAQEISADMSRTVKLTREEEAAGGSPKKWFRPFTPAGTQQPPAPARPVHRPRRRSIARIWQPTVPKWQRRRCRRPPQMS